MKTMINKIILGLLCLIVFTACEDEFLEAPAGGVAPPFGELTHDISSSEIILTQEEDSSVFANLAWSAVDFGTTKPVKYTIELGYAGKEFQKAVGIVTKEDITSYTMLVAEVNAAMIRLGVAPEESAAVEIRVRAWVDFLTDPSLSDPISVTLTPYLLTFPPRFVVGDAQGWNIGDPDTLKSFAPGIYEGVVRLQNNGNFRFFAAPDWGAEQWGFNTFATGSIPEEFVNTRDRDSNFKFTGITAKYKMIVNFNTQVITLEPLGPPPPPSEMFLVTPSTVDFDLVPELSATAEGVREYQGVVMLEKNTKFRIFEEKDWSAAKLNWTFFEGGVADSRLTNSGDELSNILFTGETGWYIMTVSVEDASITLEETSEPSQSLYLVGNGYVGGWDMAKALSFNSLGDNKFEAVGTFKAGKFRFFNEADWGADQYGYNYFAGGSVDTELADGADNDSNFSFVGDPGTYKITVSLAEKTVVMEPVPAPTLHLLGSGQSWNAANAVPLTWKEGGIYEGTVDFSNRATFRLFANNDPAAWDWAGEQWRFSSFAEGTIDPAFEDAGGADSNFRFVGTDGTYTVRVNIYDLTVELVE